MAELKIYSQIQTAEGVTDLQYMGYDGVCYRDVDSFISSIPEEDNEINVRLHCEGGVCSEGWAIYDRLRASGKDITCTVDGMAASMATVILMAAPKEKRRAYANSTLLVHNPYIMPWALGEHLTADDLKKESERMQQEQSRILDLYVERCGCGREEMQRLMDENKPITAEAALEIGLIGEIIAPISARASVNNIMGLEMEEKTEVKRSLLDKMLAKLGFSSVEDVEEDSLNVVEDTAESEGVMGMELATADGGKLVIERENGTPQIGDKAEPDGEHEMPDGRVIVVVDGVIEDIKTNEDETDDTDELEALKKENEALKEQLAEAMKMAKTTDDLRILNAVKMAGGEDVLKTVASGYVPDTRKTEGKDAAKRALERTDESPMAREIAARKKGEWTKN